MKARVFCSFMSEIKEQKYRNQKKKNFQVALDPITHVVKSVKLLLSYNLSVVLLTNLTNPKQI
jgi:hypothetical protein